MYTVLSKSYTNFFGTYVFIANEPKYPCTQSLKGAIKFNTKEETEKFIQENLEDPTNYVAVEIPPEML